MVKKEDQIKDKYIFEEGMGEISGFGGGYEQTCRNMLKSGLEWWDQHPNADPKFHGYVGIYGHITGDNKDAKALSKAVVKGANGDCTGAMHQAVITSIAWIRKYGWKKYIKLMKKGE